MSPGRGFAWSRRLARALRRSLQAVRECPCLRSRQCVQWRRSRGAACLRFRARICPRRAIRFVDDEDVGDLHNAGLDRLHVVAHAGHQHHHRHLRQRRDLDFVLSHAHGFDDHEVAAGGIHQSAPDRAVARASPPVAAARRHGADEDAGVGVMLLHADAVAQNRAAGDAAGGIDRDDRHGLALAPQLARSGHRPACFCPRRAGR